MKCPKCQCEVPERSNFCNHCGHNLKGLEQASGIVLNQPHAYPPKFLADKILANRRRLEGERKWITVLFLDVAGFTSISEKLDPEEMREIMDGYFKIVTDEIHKYEGIINQFTGDGVMALFGAPVAIENHAQNACRAALSTQSALKNYKNRIKQKHGFKFETRAGINTGPVIVGVIGDDFTMDYTAIGDTVNLASRMESLAEPGHVLISPNTYKQVRQQFVFKPMGKVTVKGKEKPLDVYELVQAKIDRPRLGVERQLYSMMVGRDRELNSLELQISKAINKQGSVINVIGEAGIGKSRLIAELKQREVIKKVTFLEGRAISIGRNLSFHPIINLLKNWAGIKDEDPAVTVFNKLEKAIRSVGQTEADEILPFAATLMGMKLSGKYAERIKGIEGESLEKLIFKNMRDLIIKSTELTPLVVMIEDLHWADTSSIELLESMFRLAETQRIVFINVFRPNHAETGDRIIETIKEKLPVYYVEIRLQPLNEKMSETLIHNMLNIKGLSYSVIDRITERSGGNPFFIEEVVRSFIDEGAVVKANGEYKVTDKIESIEIPHTINDVLTARIDRLDESTRELLKTASVIGRSFFYRVLTEVARAIEDLDNRLAYLKEVELIRERRRMEELEYLFKHALAQEAAYESILQQKRKDLHKRVADAIETVFSERLYEFYGMLAFHYSQAENLDKTEEYLIKAGEEALRSSASAEALIYCQQALDLYLRKAGEKADPKKVAMLEKNIALALYNRGQYTESIPYFDKALFLYGDTTPKHQIAKVLKLGFSMLVYISALRLPSLYWKKVPTQEEKESLALSYRKLEALSVTDPEEWFVQAIYFYRRFTKFDFTKIDAGPGYCSMGVILFAFSGLSFALSRRSLTLTEENINAADFRSIFYYKTNLKIHDMLSGELRDEIEIDQELIDKMIAIGEFFYVTVYINWISFVCIERGSFKAAHNLIQKFSDIAETYEHDWAKVSIFIHNGLLLMSCRRLQESINNLQEGILLTERTGFRVWLIFMYSIKARAHMLLGDFHAAENSLEKAEKIISEMAVVPINVAPFFLARFVLSIQKIEEALKQSDKKAFKKYRIEAVSARKKALKIAKKVSLWKIETLKTAGVFYWNTGKQRKAIKWWRRAFSVGKRMQYRPELSRTYFEVGKRLMEPGSKYKELNGITAEEYLEKARSMFEEMDLQWDLDELDKLAPAR